MTYKLLFASLLLLTAACTSQPKEEQKPVALAEHWYWDAAWSPDGRYILAGGTGDTLRLFDAESYQQVQEYVFPGMVTKIKWHPDSKRAAIAMQGGQSPSMILHHESRQVILLDSLDSFGARAIGWNHDGSRLAVGDYRGNLSIYDTHGKLLQQVPTGQKALIALSWQPGSQQILTVGDHITLYTTEGDSLLHIEDRKEATLMLTADWHPTGAFFITGDYGDFEKGYPPLLLYCKATGEVFKTLTQGEKEYRNICWSPDGLSLAIAGGGLARYNSDGTLLGWVAKEQTNWGVNWSPDGKRLVTTSRDGSITIWNRDLSKVQDLQF